MDMIWDLKIMWDTYGQAQNLSQTSHVILKRFSPATSDIPGPLKMSESQIRSHL